MDIIRCFALLCVVSVHFFLNTDYYYLFLTGPRMYLLTLLRTASMSCVPLFILLSGYLLNKKKPTKKYFSKIWKTLVIYVLASSCCYLYSHYLSPGAPGSGSFGELIRQTLAFYAAPYAWYINMYLGLFFLIPYLNLIFHGLSSKKDRLVLIVILLVLTALPGMLNVFQYNNGWHFSGKSLQYDQIFPNFWQLFYPVTYYILGAYLREHPFKIKRIVHLGLTLLAIFLNGSMNYLICQHDYFLHGSWQDWQALPNVIQSVMIFSFLAQGDYSRLGPKTCNLLAKMSECCLGAFLVSWIFDCIFYPILERIQPVMAYQIPYYPVIVLVIFTCSLGLSALLNGIYNLFSQLLSLLISKKSAAK